VAPERERVFAGIDASQAAALEADLDELASEA